MTDFARRLDVWFADHGRHDLPWQRGCDAYRIWVSEIMLQQTQVATVIPYFERFIARFPDVVALADAPADAVMAAWSGLGYYARARNLHAAARCVRDNHAGRFPMAFDQVMALPGIGRSTAGAILALAHGQRHAILDGNCKRVYARHAGIEGWPGTSAVAAKLWAVAEQHTPNTDVARYTQAIMDLGASVCTRTAPTCDACPVAGDCRARIESRIAELPASRPRRAHPMRTATVMVLTNAHGEVLLEKRPDRGIWGGMWVLPEVEDAPDGVELPLIRHRFTHFTLDIQPVHRIVAGSDSVQDGDTRSWIPLARIDEFGVPQPVRRILAMLDSTP